MKTLLHIDGRSLCCRCCPNPGSPGVSSSNPTGRRGGTSCFTAEMRMTPLHPSNPTDTQTAPSGCVAPPIPLADSGLLLTPLDLETVFSKLCAPLFQLLFPDDCLLGTSIPQDFLRVESDEKEMSPFRLPSYSDEPLWIVLRPPCTSIVPLVVFVVPDSLRDTREPNVRVWGILQTSCGSSVSRSCTKISVS